MGLVPRGRDGADRIINQERRLKFQEIRRQPSGGGGRQFENFIIDPPTVRTYPPAFVAAGEIIGVRWRVGSGSAAILFFHEGVLIHNTGTVSGEGSHTLDTPVATADGDQIYPQITSVFSDAQNVTMSFLVET